jgi:hypothetical protein
VALRINDCAISVNGNTAVVDTSTSTLPVDGSTVELQIGHTGGTSEFLNGYLRKIAYYPARLPNATLQAITAV